MSKHFGKCKLCGKETELTFEHVPPQKAFNSIAVKKYDSNEAMKLIAGADGRMPWNMDGLFGKIDQKGSGDYYLCQQCNNDTGSWYMNEYVKFANMLGRIVFDPEAEGKTNCSFEFKNIYPLRIFKAIIAMFCDINYGCLGDDSIRNYLLNKNSIDFDCEKYSVYMYLTRSFTRRILPIIGVGKIGIDSFLITEVSCIPVGLLLYINKPKDYIPEGLLLNDFSSVKYNKCIDVNFVGVPIHEVNSQFPADFRTREQIIKDYEDSMAVMEEMKRNEVKQ